MSTETLLTIAEVAQRLNVSVYTIRAWVGQRRIDSVRLGRAVRIPATEIHRLVESGHTPARRLERAL
jgi:excisionase family DNA binding protein